LKLDADNAKSEMITMKLSLAVLFGAVAFNLLAEAGSAPSPVPVSSEQRSRTLAEQLASDLVSPDVSVRNEAIRNLSNHEYRDLTDAEKLAAILPAIRTPDTNSSSLQGLLIEKLHRILPTNAKETMPILHVYISDETVSPYLRHQAILSAARIAPHDPLLLTNLIHAATPEAGKSAAEITPAIKGLGRMGRFARSALPLLHKFLLPEPNFLNKSGDFEWLSGYAFEAIGKIVFDSNRDRDFTTLLLDGDLEVRAAAYAQIFNIASAPSGNPFLYPQTPNELDPMRNALVTTLEGATADFEKRVAVKAIMKIKPGGDARLIKTLVDHGPTDANAYMALEMTAPTDPAAVRVLIEALRGKRQPQGIWTKMAVVRTLTHYGTNAQEAVPDLMEGLDQMLAIPNHQFHTEAVGDLLAALTTVAPENHAVIRRILDFLAPDHPLSRPPPPYKPIAPFAMKALAVIGVPSDPALHAAAVARLTNSLLDTNLTASALATLERTSSQALAPDSAIFVPVLIRVLQTIKSPEAGADFLERHRFMENLSIRASTIRVLAKFGTAAGEAIPILQQLADREPLRADYDAANGLENRITLEAQKTLSAISGQASNAPTSTKDPATPQPTPFRD
jgi:hypothetical protein